MELTTSSVVAEFLNVPQYVSEIMGYSLLSILGLFSALVGLGWAITKIQSKITGKKF